MSNPTAFPEKVNRREERHVPDDLILASLFFRPDWPIKQHAEALGLSVRWLSIRLQSPALKAKLAEQRAATFADALKRAESLAVQNVNAVQTIIDSPESRQRDKIAAVALQFSITEKLHTICAVTPRLAGVEAQLAELTSGPTEETTAEPAGEEIPAEVPAMVPAEVPAEVPATVPEPPPATPAPTTPTAALPICPKVLERIRQIRGRFGAAD